MGKIIPDGIFHGHAGQATVLAAAHSSTAGFFWLINPIGSGKKIRVKKIKVTNTPIAATAFTSAPRVTAERMTFTGVSSATNIDAANAKATGAQTAKLVAATTGLTPSAGFKFTGFVVGAVITAVGIGIVQEQEWNPDDEEEYIILDPGQGIVIRQDSAGTTSDTRIIEVDITWDEYG